MAVVLTCCGGTGDESSARSSSAILNGTIVTDFASPVVTLSSPGGQCTAMLIAPNLVVTARHCVAQTSDGAFTCTPQGELASTANGAGQMGADEALSSISFFTNGQVIDGGASAGAPAAVAQKIISTGSLTVCRDDLAFVVLDRPIPGITPAPIRLSATMAQEFVDSWGYGLTATPRDTFNLRVRRDVRVVGVGPDSPPSTTQIAPVRAIRIGPDDITCNGDSGGPITSSATGAVIAVASLGNEADFTMPACTDFGTPDTTGPRLNAYPGLAMQAFAAAGATPNLETPLDAGVTDAGVIDGSLLGDGGASPESSPFEIGAGGGSCSIGFAERGRSTSLALIGMTLAAALAAVGRRRR